jgi:hypothetical protein
MRILVVVTHVWPLAARISVALVQVGFQVATVSPRGGLVRETRAATIHYTYSPKEGRRSIAAAIREWQPDLLVCTDDQAVKHLHDLHVIASKLHDADSQSLVQLIEASLGHPASFPAAARKSIFISIASTAGVRCPRSWVIPDNHNEPSLPLGPYPMLVKADGTFGGKGVRVVRNEDQARNSIIELTLPEVWPDRIKQRMAKWISLLGIRRRRLRTVCLQERVIGRPANRAVVCQHGSVLAGISVEVLETQSEFGPASIVRPIEHPEMAAVANRMVERLQLSGFIGFDFVLDSNNDAWLIEMNPRVTPIAHLCLADGTSLPSTMFSKMTGQSVGPRPPLVNAETIVLFPGGFWRSHRDPCLSVVYLSSYHDVPWDEPGLIQACINYKPINGFRRYASKVLGL